MKASDFRKQHTFLCPDLIWYNFLCPDFIMAQLTRKMVPLINYLLLYTINSNFNYNLLLLNHTVSKFWQAPQNHFDILFGQITHFQN